MGGGLPPVRLQNSTKAHNGSSRKLRHRHVGDRIESQIERFAPGFRNCILARHKMGAADLEKSNPNLAGGDINGGAANLRQLIAR